MRRYRVGAHTKSDLKVHVVWVPKYRKPVLTGEVALRVRDVIRQIAMEHEPEIISGKIARDHVRVFLSYRPHQDPWHRSLRALCALRVSIPPRVPYRPW
ncbi:MAG: IS200/IS605 family transposase [Gammaproteobacteria bacterium]